MIVKLLHCVDVKTFDYIRLNIFVRVVSVGDHVPGTKFLEDYLNEESALRNRGRVLRKGNKIKHIANLPLILE